MTYKRCYKVRKKKREKIRENPTEGAECIP